MLTFTLPNETKKYICSNFLVHWVKLKTQNLIRSSQKCFLCKKANTR